MNKEKGTIFFGRWDHKTQSGPQLENALPVVLHPGKIPKAGRKTPIFNPDACLSPYHVRFGLDGPIAENYYQFSKIYDVVGRQNQVHYVSGVQGKVCVWEHPEEMHAKWNEDGSFEITEAYWRWREKGMNNPYPVRRPAGYKKPIYLIDSCGFECDYLDGRETYIDTYRCGYVDEFPIREHPRFLELKRLLNSGQDLLLLEVDGPQFNSKLGAPYSEMEEVLEVTEEIYEQARNNPNHPFGHGWCLAALLLEWI